MKKLKGRVKMELTKLTESLQTLCHEGFSKFGVEAKVGGVSSIEVAHLKDIEIEKEEEIRQQYFELKH